MAMEYLRIYPFVRYAVIVGVLVSLAASLLGETLVLKRFSFGGIFLYGRGSTDCGDKVIRCGTGSGGNTGWKVIIEMTCRHLWILTWIRILLCMI